MAESQGDVILKQADTSILLEIRPLDSTGAKITSGTLSMRLWHVVPTSGALETYDFNDDTFKTTAVTTPTAELTHRTAENAGYNTGYWNRRHTTLTVFAVGDKYKVEFSHASMSPETVLVEFQYGGADGDVLRPTTAGRTLVVDAAGLADANAVKVGPTGAGTAQTARDLGFSIPAAAAGAASGLAIVGSAMTLAAGAVTAAAVATGAIDADALAADAAVEIADAILKRGASNVEATADKNSLCGVVLKQTGRFGVGASTATTYKTDGTEFASQTATKDAAATPVTELGIMT